jgi:hypothetical protein
MLMERTPGVVITMAVVVSVDVEQFNSLGGLFLIHSNFLAQNSHLKETIQRTQTNPFTSI